MSLYCAIAGCGDPARTIYYNFLLCEGCWDAAQLLGPDILTNATALEDVLREFVMPVALPDDYETLTTEQQVRRALVECGYAVVEPMSTEEAEALA